MQRFQELAKSNATIDTSNDIGKAQKKLVELNDMAYSELILLMDIKQAGGKVAFSIVKGSKSTEYEDGNGSVDWTRLSNKYLPKTATSMVKLETEFRASRLKKGTDPDV
jgi:hypothetical protein